MIAYLQNNFSTLTIIPRASLSYDAHAWVVLRCYVPLLGHPHDHDFKCSKLQLINFPQYPRSHLFSSWFIWLRVLISVHIAMVSHSFLLFIAAPLIWQLSIASEIWSAINSYSANVDYTTSQWRCKANHFNSMCSFAWGLLSSANAIDPSETVCLGLHLL